MQATTVTRIPYFYNKFSKRSAQRITRGQQPQTCEPFPASNNLHCLNQMRPISNSLLSRSRIAQPSVEFWHLKNQMELSSPRWHNQLSLLTTNLQSPTPESPQREICWSLWSTKLETSLITMVTAPVLQTTEIGLTLKCLKRPDWAD